MSNKKSTTKKALFSSIVSLLLCFTMLIGTTFAWFTDTVTSAGNIIKSGTLDVEMHWADGTEAPASATWTDASQGAIFNYDLWEPGFTEVRHIKIANVGSLALKYQVVITANGVVSDLADVIDVYYIDPAQQIVGRADLANMTSMGTLTQVLGTMNTTASGELYPAGNIDGYASEHIVTIALKMQETAGNEYQDLSIGTDFSVQLIATQHTYEEDSFDDQYDANADLVVVKSTQEMKDALASGAKEIYLAAKVDLDAANAGSVTDLNGVTIIGINSDAAIVAKGTGGGYANVNLKNLTVIDETCYTYENGENAWEFTYLELEGNNTFSNVIFTDGILIGDGNSIFNDCTFIGHNNDSSTLGNVTMYGAWVYSGTAFFTDCTFYGTRGLKVADQYSGSDVTEVIVDNCFFGPLSEKPGVAVDNRIGTLSLTIKNSIFAGTQYGDTSIDHVPHIYENDDRTPDATTINLENNIVKSDENVKVITNAEELKALGGQSLDGTIVLATDIDLGGDDMPTIGAAYGKSLTVLGNGHTISNANLSHTNHNGMKHHSLFYVYTNSTLSVSDLIIENVNIDTTNDVERNYGVAVVVGYADGGSTVILDNVDVNDCSVINDNDEAAVYIGYHTGTVNMTDCDSTGCYVQGETPEKTGAFIGMVAANATATLTNCTTDLTIGSCNRVEGTLIEQ